jgi:hypothetical protein
MKTNSTSYSLLLLSSVLFGCSTVVISFPVLVFLFTSFRTFFIRQISTPRYSICGGAINMYFLFRELLGKYSLNILLQIEKLFFRLAFNTIKHQHHVPMRT